MGTNLVLFIFLFFTPTRGPINFGHSKSHFLFPLLLASSTEARYEGGIGELQIKPQYSHIDFTSNAVYVSNFDFLCKYPTFKYSKTNKKTHNGSAKKIGILTFLWTLASQTKGTKKIKHVNMNLIAKYNTVSTYTAQRGISILIKKNLGTIENDQTLGNSTIFFDIKNNDNKTLI